MPSSTASSTPRTALPSTARPCANHRKNPPSVESLTLTPPSEPLNLSMGATVRDHRNAVRDRSESLSAIDRNHCPHSPESAPYRQFTNTPSLILASHGRFNTSDGAPDRGESVGFLGFDFHRTRSRRGSWHAMP